MSAPVAIITDIHANLPALEAALTRIEELGIEEIYCGGDLVGYGPHPDTPPIKGSDYGVFSKRRKASFAGAHDRSTQPESRITPAVALVRLGRQR